LKCKWVEKTSEGLIGQLQTWLSVCTRCSETGRVEATLKDGLLELTLPKTAQSKKINATKKA